MLDEVARAVSRKDRRKEWDATRRKGGDSARQPDLWDPLADTWKSKGRTIASGCSAEPHQCLSPTTRHPTITLVVPARLRSHWPLQKFQRANQCRRVRTLRSTGVCRCRRRRRSGCRGDRWSGRGDRERQRRLSRSRQGARRGRAPPRARSQQRFGDAERVEQAGGVVDRLDDAKSARAR